MSRAALRSILLTVSAATLASCGGGDDSPTSPQPSGTITTTFRGTTRATGPMSCSGDSHSFRAAAGPVSVTLNESTGNVTLGVQVCVDSVDDNNCTINLMPIAVGSTATGTAGAGLRTQVLKMNAPNCGGGGPVPPGPVEYTVTVVYKG
jgi:hypothetical protein